MWGMGYFATCLISSTSEYEGTDEDSRDRNSSASECRGNNEYGAWHNDWSQTPDTDTIEHEP